MIKRLLLIAGIFLSTWALGQSDGNLLPVKTDGKWGFIDNQKNWVIPPAYDFCLPFEDRDFTWVKKDSQSLLINKQGRATQTLAFQNISEIHGDIIVYRHQNLLGWYNKATNRTIDAQYLKLEFLEATDHFITTDTATSSLVDINNNLVIREDSLDHIIFDEYYYISKNNKTGIYTTDGQNIIPKEYVYITPYPDHFIAQVPSGEKHIYQKDGALIYKAFFADISPVYGSYFQCAKDGMFYLLNSKTGMLEDSVKGRYTHFRNSLIQVANKNGRGLYNIYLKKRIIEPQFKNLYNQLGSSYTITYDGSQFGLVDTMGNTPNEELYASIGPFKNNVCIVRKNGAYGLIGPQAQALLSVDYTFVAVGDDGVVKAKRDSIFYLYEFDSLGQMVDSMRFNRTGTLRLGGRISMSIVNGQQSTANQISQYWYQDERGKWGLRNTEGRVVVAPIYDEVRKLRGTSLVLGKVFASRTTRLTRSTTVMSSSSYGLVDERRFRAVMRAGILYIDTSALGDTATNVMRIITGGAYFATVNKYSGRIMRYNTKYISEYKNGYAKIFMGTKMVLSTSPRNCNIRSINSYLAEFGFTSRDNSLNRRRRYLLYLDGLGYWGYLDRDGKFISQPREFSLRKIVQATDFHNHRAIITTKDSLYGMINTDGEYILQPLYKHISFLPNTNHTLIKTTSAQKRYGYVSDNGKVISPVQYTKALPFTDNSTWCFTDYTTCLLRKDGSRDTFSAIHRISAFYNGYGGLADRRKMAIIDSNGTLLSSYHYSRLGQYAEGLMPAKKSRVFGYLDDNGEWAIEPQYYKAGPFVNGVAMVRYSPKYSNRKFYGYINREGEFTTKGKYTRAESINKQGYAIVRKGNQKGIINSKGELIIKPKYTKVYYGEGYFTTYVSGTTTLRDSTGKKIKKIRGSMVKSGVSDGKQVVKRLRNTGAIDTQGEKTVNFNYLKLAPFENGKSVTQRRRTAHIIYENGDTLAKVQGKAKGGFHSGHLLIQNGKRYFYVNSSGQNVFNIYFEDAEPFVNGLARVKLNNKWGLIDSDGFYRIIPQYGFVDPPSNGVCIVGLNETSGICDLNAFYIVAPRCNTIRYLPTENLYQYTYKNEFGYIDTEGKIIWEVE